MGLLKSFICLAVLLVVVNSKSFPSTDVNVITLTPEGPPSYFKLKFKVESGTEGTGSVICVAIDILHVAKAPFQIPTDGNNVIVTIEKLVSERSYLCKAKLDSRSDLSNEVTVNTTKFVNAVVPTKENILITWEAGVLGATEKIQVIIDENDFGSPIGITENYIEINEHLIPCKTQKIQLKNAANKDVTFAIVEAKAFETKPNAPSKLEVMKSKEKTELIFIVTLSTEYYECSIDKVEVECDKKTGETTKIVGSVAEVTVSGLTADTDYKCNAFAYHGDLKSLASEETKAKTNNSNLFIANNFTLLTGVLFILITFFRY